MLGKGGGIKNKHVDFFYTFKFPNLFFMKTLQRLLLAILLLGITFSYAQEQYTIDGTTYTLNTETEGTITLLWNSIDGQYRFFSKNGASIEELVNTKVNGDYQEEYKTVLQNQTGSDVGNLKLTLGSLRTFFDNYNAGKDSNYKKTPKVQLQTRLGLFAGLTNNVYFENPTNAIQPKIGVEFELIDAAKLKRHGIVFRLSQTFESDDQKVNATQFSLNYRFKFIKKEMIDIYVNTKIATYNYNTSEVLVPATDTAPMRVEETSSNGLDAPLAFGLGADFKVGPGYIIVSYNDIVAITQDNNGEFPVDFSLGYKIGL